MRPTPPARFLLPPLAALLLAACAGREPRPEAADATAPQPAPAAATEPAAIADAVRVSEAFMTPLSRADEVDSVAAWSAPLGETWLIATAKEADQLLVYDGDRGHLLHRIGGSGKAPGQFRRPNGIAVWADFVFVVERDNRRVQVLRLPDFAPVAVFGEAELRNPYGLWLRETGVDELEMLVTDSFMADYKTDLVPPMTELAERVKRYRVVIEGDSVQAGYLGQFGDTTEAGALRMVESIAGDPVHRRLLIAEEDTRVGTTLREYTLDGKYTGLNLPPERFQAQAEGVALWACPDGSGYWLTADQSQQRTVFHVFDRESLDFRGSFAGDTVALTDGIALHPASTLRFPYGVFYAAHDDQGVGAFDWRDIARALKLRVDCDKPAP